MATSRLSTRASAMQTALTHRVFELSLWPGVGGVYREATMSGSGHSRPWRSKPQHRACPLRSRKRTISEPSRYVRFVPEMENEAKAVMDAPSGAESHIRWLVCPSARPILNGKCLGPRNV